MFDPIKDLMDNVRLGFFSVIRYRKEGELTLLPRVIAPRRLCEGRHGLMVRAQQISPEPGFRTFKAGQILSVERDTERMPDRIWKLAVDEFCSGEVFVVSAEVRQATDGVTTIISASDNRASQQQSTSVCWSQPWFSEFARVVRDAVLDLRVSRDDQNKIKSTSFRLGLSVEQENAVYCYVLGEEQMGISVDGAATNEELLRLDMLADCLKGLRRMS
ncbi:MAG TPA: hypothetical protein VF777_00020 [Phycisphaerales bacterium]